MWDCGFQNSTISPMLPANCTRSPKKRCKYTIVSPAHTGVISSLTTRSTRRCDQSSTRPHGGNSSTMSQPNPAERYQGETGAVSNRSSQALGRQGRLQVRIDFKQPVQFANAKQIANLLRNPAQGQFSGRLVQH